MKPCPPLAAGILLTFALCLIPSRRLAIEDTRMVHSNGEVHKGHLAVVRKMWFINLNSHTKRRTLQEENARYLPSHIAYKRWPAVSVASMKQLLDDPNYREFLVNASGFGDNLEGLALENPEKVLTPRHKFTLSVCMSHFSALRQAYVELRGHFGAVMVFEDDVLFNDKSFECFERFLNNAPSDWQLVRFATWGGLREEDRVSSDSVFYKARQPFWVINEGFYGA